MDQALFSTNQKCSFQPLPHSCSSMFQPFDRDNPSGWEMGPIISSAPSHHSLVPTSSAHPPPLATKLTASFTRSPPCKKSTTHQDTKFPGCHLTRMGKKDRRSSSRTQRWNQLKQLPSIELQYPRWYFDYSPTARGSARPGEGRWHDLSKLPFTTAQHVLCVIRGLFGTEWNNTLQLLIPTSGQQQHLSFPSFSMEQIKYHRWIKMQSVMQNNLPKEGRGERRYLSTEVTCLNAATECQADRSTQDSERLRKRT